jgi:PAS domain S-box-containing protein
VDPAGLARFVFSALIVSWLCGTLFTSRERARSAETRLRESERIYRAIEESIRFGIWICDAEGRNTYASQSFLDLIGLTQEQYSNSGWRKVLHPDDVERTLADWNSCVASGGTWDVEQLFLGKDGQYHPVLARGAPVRDDRGQTICWAGINLDISRLKQAEVELERQAVELRHSNRELEQFAFAASHDMREPLRVVNIYSELLVKAVGQPDRAADMQMFATYIHQSVDKLERLIRVSAGVAVDQALETLSNSIGESGIRVVRGDLPGVLADEGQLTQVFQNLLSNAIKYRRREGEAFVQISAQTSEGKAIFLVEDNGIGFDPIHAHSIFGLFKRLHGRDYEGTGLGLAICQRIIDHHRGRIWAESQPGEGSKFFFILPLAEQTLSAALTENQEQSTRDVN